MLNHRHRRKSAMRRRIREFVIAVLPKGLAHRWTRTLLDLSLAEANDSVKVELAASAQDLKAALALVQRNFEREGYAKKTTDGVRITPYHLLPETLVIVAKIDDQVVATISVVPRTRFGIPLDGSFDLTSFLQDKGKVVEVSALAVDSDYRREQGAALFKLMKFMYHCNIDVLGANTEVIGVNPRMIGLYEAILLFSRIPKARTVAYDFANGAPVVPMYFRLDTAMESFSRVYKGKPPRQNMMSFFLKDGLQGFSLPSSSELNRTLPQRDPQRLKAMLGWSPEMVQNLTAENRSHLKALYAPWPDCQRVINEVLDAR